MKPTKGYKISEVGIIPEDWIIEKVRDLALIKTGGRNTQDRVDDGEFPFFVRSNTVERIDTYSFDGEAVLTAGDGVGVGKVYHYINGKFDCHQRVYRITDFSDKIYGFFFFQYFSNNFLKRIMQMTAKSSVDSVRMEMIADMPIPLPPTIAEQKAIATALSDMDALISRLEKLIEKKRAIKQGMMQELLKPKEGWEVKKLRDLLIEFQNGFAFSADGYVASGVPIVTMAQIGLDGSFNFDESKVNYWRLEKFQKLRNYHLVNGDLIIAMTDVTPEKNLIGRMAIVKSKDTLLLNQRVGLLRLDKNNVNPYVLKACSNMRSWRTYCIGAASLGVQANIGTKDILQGEFILPKIEAQNEIAETLIDMDNEVESLEVKLSKYRQLKQGMMQELLTGKTRLI